MRKKTSTKHPAKICAECGSELIFVEEITMTVGNALSPVTKTIYHCSNQTCQEESERKEAQRREFRLQQETLKQNRLNNRHSTK
ncbi:hypothetical protein M1563_02790 [Patescibacteria group bacterium]|nr:hypothetical protein [Patescibacteria group bacterium]MCL5409918.1 hypothetical protein [Patescibacteria group bacterium]